MTELGVPTGGSAQLRPRVLTHRRDRPVRAPARGPGSVWLYTCSVNPSGMGVHMLSLARHLVESGVRVVVGYWPAPAAEALMSQAGEVGATAVRTPHPRDPSYGRELRALIAAAAPDVFHAHVGTGREDFGGARAARAVGVPAVVETLHLPWLLHARPKRDSFFASLGAVDQLIVVSEAQRATYERIGVPRASLVTVPNGVVPRGAGPGRAAARRALDLDPAQPVIMTIGRLVGQKGHRYLLDALPGLLGRWPDLAAVIVGEGSLRRDLEERAARIGVERAVRLVGQRPDARALLDAADLFVLPSKEEAMPMVALEAMDAGLPVVGTRVIGTTEVVQDGVTGRLVPARDPGALGAALAELLADRELARRLGQEGRRVFQQRFTASRMAAETLAVYRQTLRRVVGAPSTAGAAR